MSYLKASADILTFGPPEERQNRQNLLQLMRECPIPDDEMLKNLGLFLVPQTLSRILFMDFLYRQIIDVQGSVVEFGCRWGQNTSLFAALRGIYEPFNRLRTVTAFDTFSGFPAVSGPDGGGLRAGQYTTVEGYETYLQQVLELQEQESPMGHLRKFEIVKGDVTQTLPTYLEENPSTMVALAYFDLDIYQPTKTCLNLIKDRITRGTVIGFDELNDRTTPGETVAVMETLGLARYPIKRFPASARTSYLIVT
jgi:hypothetical protein